ncbi:TetR/AcrR family transcriptional regulator [Pontibacter sp. E15-1]|uniref:TetR/AcrR family transcriptional regulator n=1 Tax=Pontibacter sp. E15-1 TaxID=2919918 RepID=UPI001F502153|nr:TetR/AcrR family transcriptional regulator [Pontibacter sp. E15-1]MCJ8163264.1 TetR/AcrR family transcriptional regulator [Pontibacter sp. E15-1]
MTTDVTYRQLEIIEAAGKILSASGVSGLTIKNMAKEMKFSESAIYRHFSSKEDIIVAMLNYLAEKMDERFTKVSEGAGTPEEKFRALFQSQFMFFEQKPYFVVAVLSDGLMEESQRINEALLKIMKVKMSHLLPTLVDGQQSGVFTDEVTAEMLTHVVMASFRLQMLKWRLSGFKADIHEDGNKLLDALLIIIKKK